MRPSALRDSALYRGRDRMRAPWSWALAGLCCGVLGAVLVFAPAVWMERVANAMGQGRVVLSDSTGTVWSGSAQLALSGGQGSRDAVRLPGRLHWVMGLGWDHVKTALSADCCTAGPILLQLAPRIGWPLVSGWHLQVHSSESNWPAALLAGLGTPWNTVRAEGSLGVSTSGFSIHTALDRVVMEGHVQLDARDMRSSLSTLAPLGSYRLLLTGGEQPALALTTLGGPLQLQGQGQWTSGRLRFVGEASAAPSHEQELSNLLNIMGRRDGVRSRINIG